ncbi:MAG: hypothetical protein HN413_17120 [Chloroflexi bacterium]|nr:hypothetical protein [Chloroflexota bacterium]
MTRKSLAVWGLNLLLSVAVWLTISALFFGNEYGYFAPRGLLKSAILLPFIFLGFIIWTKWGTPTCFKNLRVSAFICGLIAVLLLCLFPLPIPALSAQHSLQMTAFGGPVEIRQVKYLDGTPVSLDVFQLTDDWHLSGMMPGGVVLSVRHNVDAGKLSLLWDGEPTEIDLSAPQSVTTDIVLGQTDAASGWILLVKGFYFLALWVLIFIFAFIVETRWLHPAAVKALLVILYLAIFAVFTFQKLSYTTFSGERVFRDTAWYVETADEPLNSLEFWAGTRPFTLPLFYKLTGVTQANYLDANVIRDTVDAQYWFSILSWAALGLVFSLLMRQSWLRPLAFGIILFFSLNLEVSLWESLLLSESLSFSIFALLIAAWLWWNAATKKPLPPQAGVAFVFLAALLTILYSFTRESNQYFAVFGALLFPIAGLFGKVPRQNRKFYWVYLLLFFGVLVLKNVSFGASDLWQIHMADLLALRILPDAKAVDYFIAAGLPMSENLLKMSAMPGHEYQPYLLNDPQMAAAMNWINQYGVATYAKFLITHPLDSMIAPLQQLPSILSGDNLEYHLPRFGVPTIPLWLQTLTARFYPRDAWVMWGFFFLMSVGAGAYFFSKRNLSPAWLVVAVFLVSLYPLMFIVWHGNPIEIERHAAPVGIQFRLAGWMAVALLLDQLAKNNHRDTKFTELNQ